MKIHFKMMLRLSAIIICTITLFSVLNDQMILAQNQGANPQTNPQQGASPQTTQTGDPVSLNNPLGNTAEAKDVRLIIGRVINGVLGVVGSLALIMFVYGGLLWMTSGGNDEKVKQGKDVLVWATLGLFIIFASYALVNFIIFKGIGAVGGNGGGIQTDQYGRVLDPNNPDSN